MRYKVLTTKGHMKCVSEFIQLIFTIELICLKTLGETTSSETKNSPQVVNSVQIKCEFPVQTRQEPSIKKQKRSNVSF